MSSTQQQRLNCRGSRSEFGPTNYIAKENGKAIYTKGLCLQKKKRRMDSLSLKKTHKMFSDLGFCWGVVKTGSNREQANGLFDELLSGAIY
jgi:hypothetical protein